MPTRLNPYLSLKNNARQAMEFYKDVFGGELYISTFKEFHATDNPAEENLIMHSMLELKNGEVLMAADTPSSMGEPSPNSVISLSGDDEEELRGYWNKLVQGGTITQPLEKAPWGDIFGMLTDKFGVPWMVNISTQQQ